MSNNSGTYRGSGGVRIEPNTPRLLGSHSNHQAVSPPILIDPVNPLSLVPRDTLYFTHKNEIIWTVKSQYKSPLDSEVKLTVSMEYRTSSDWFIKCLLWAAPRDVSAMKCWCRKRLTLCRAYSLVHSFSGFCNTARPLQCSLMDGRLPGLLRCSDWPGPALLATHWPPRSSLLAHTDVSLRRPPETSGKIKSRGV